MSKSIKQVYEEMEEKRMRKLSENLSEMEKISEVNSLIKRQNFLDRLSLESSNCKAGGRIINTGTSTFIDDYVDDYMI